MKNNSVWSNDIFAGIIMGLVFLIVISLLGFFGGKMYQQTTYAKNIKARSSYILVPRKVHNSTNSKK